MNTDPESQGLLSDPTNAEEANKTKLYVIYPFSALAVLCSIYALVLPVYYVPSMTSLAPILMPVWNLVSCCLPLALVRSPRLQKVIAASAVLRCIRIFFGKLDWIFISVSGGLMDLLGPTERLANSEVQFHWAVMITKAILIVDINANIP